MKRGALVAQDMVKDEELKAFLDSAFTSKTVLQESQVPKIWDKGWSKEDGRKCSGQGIFN